MIENLHTKNMKELRAIAKDIGLAGVKAESAAALRARITLTMQPGLLDELNKNGTEGGRKSRTDPTPIHWLTADEVKEALAPLKGKLQLAFYNADNEPSTDNAKIWHIKNGAAEDSGSMSISLKWLKIKAGEIANARFPAKIARSGTDLDGSLSV